jgi:valyl-tRNA synthetase
VATTRPETMLGDSGVAVHPDDPRYAGMVGKMVRLPLLGREIPIVADEAVDREFGTGAVKVTPAHDPLDFEIGLRHELAQIKVIDEAGLITREGGEFFGQDRFEARETVWFELERQGYLVGAEDHHHSVGHCSRCGTVVEPLLSEQWFVKVRPLADPAMASVKEGRTVFWPRRWENNYFRWMEELRDWCISRQLWWGHRIPAWYCDACGEVIVSEEDPTSCTECGGGLRREEDVLDTWFSSALFPFSTMGWPEETEDLDRFYPTSVLVTGFDIITFWVSRMMMMGVHFTGTEPFADVVIHGMVRDHNGRKMSKSFGNVIDPLELVDKYGADAVRLSLLRAAAPGNDIPFDEQWVDGTRRFGNKLWNAVRFAVEHVGVAGVSAEGGYPDEPGPEDAWILQRLAAVTAEYDALADQYRLSDALALAYNFAWSEVFDWYLEMAKTPLKDPDRAAVTKTTLGVVLRDLLKLFHPAIPFLTEELWGELGDGSLLITASWPSPPAVQGPDGVDDLQELVSALRRFQSEHQLARGSFGISLDDPKGVVADWWATQLTVLSGVDVLSSTPPEDLSGHTRVPAARVAGYVPLEGLIDVDAERPRLEKAIADVQQLLAASEAKLANPSFRERAPAEVVAREEGKRAEFAGKLAKLETQLAELG